MISPDALRDPWWRELPKREVHGAPALKVDPKTDLCGPCGIARDHHTEHTKAGCDTPGDWRVCYYVANEYDKPGEAEDGHLDTWMIAEDGERVEFGDISAQAPPPRPPDSPPADTNSV